MRGIAVAGAVALALAACSSAERAALRAEIETAVQGAPEADPRHIANVCLGQSEPLTFIGPILRARCASALERIGVAP
jgi:hypothetical protein